MQRRSFIRLAGGGAVAAASLGSVALTGCTSGMPVDAIEAWKGPDAALAERDVRRWLLSFAILAPHSHNLQSWIADLRVPGEITLLCDLKRVLPETDPLSRQIMMSHGTFLELLDLAARQRGLRADITLFPQGEFGPAQLDARPVARVRLTSDSHVKADPLFAQILFRHTNRKVYDITRPVPADARAAMMAAVNPDVVQIGFASGDDAAAMRTHRRIALQAWTIELSTPRTIMESYDVLRVGAQEVSAHRDGLTLLDPVPVALERLGLFDRSKPPLPDDYATTSQIKDFDAKLASTPAFVWMVTQSNDRQTQVHAGRAYARLQLAATAQGLSMQPLSQALQEYPEMKAPYTEIHRVLGATAPGNTVQMWARVGYAPTAEPAPRRRLEDFILG